MALKNKDNEKVVLSDNVQEAVFKDTAEAHLINLTFNREHRSSKSSGRRVFRISYH